MTFSLIKTKTKQTPHFTFGLAGFCFLARYLKNLSGWGQHTFIFLAYGSAGQPWCGLSWAHLGWLGEAGLLAEGQMQVPRGSASGPRMKGQRPPEACFSGRGCYLLKRPSQNTQTHLEPVYHVS